MARILTSVHGRKLGLGDKGQLIAPGGIMIGEHGAQTTVPSSKDVVFFDDFLGDVISDQWNALEGTDAATSAAAILAGGINGVLRLTTGDAGTGIAADMEELVTALQWQASEGGLYAEAKLQLSAITTCYAFFGFTDNASTLEAPIISAGSANTITTNATDAVGFMFDTNMTTDNWWLVGVANDVDATAQNSGYAPVAGTYATLRVEVSSAGAATFFYNGVPVGTTMSGAVTASADLTPVIAVSKLSVAASMTMDVDYISVRKSR